MAGVEKSGIVPLSSATALATRSQPMPAKAIVFIRQQACHGIQVADVLRHVSISRTSLEPRFKKILGRTVHQEIHRVRLLQVRELLTKTEMPIKQIATQTGFRHPEYLMRLFRQTTGQTLKQYRRAART